MSSMNNNHVPVPRSAEDGRILKFDAGNCFAKFFRLFLGWLKSCKLGIVLQDDNIHIPIRPDAAINRMDAANFLDPPQPNDQYLIATYRKEFLIWTGMCEQVLAAFKESLSQSVQTYLRSVAEHYELATRENILRLIQLVRVRYGGYSVSKAQFNYDAMRTIPAFTSVASADNGLRMMDELVEQRIGWGNANEVFTDGQMRNFLVGKLAKWSELSYVKGSIDVDPGLTYMECRELLGTTLTRLQDELLLKTDEARLMSARASCLYAQQVDLVDDRKDIFSSIDQWQGSAASSNVLCFNCEGFGHLAYQCTAPWCYKCHAVWAAIDAPGYHLSTMCPTVVGTNRKRPQDVESLPPWKRQQVQRTNGRVQMSSRGREVGGRYRGQIGGRAPFSWPVRSMQPSRSTYPPRGTGAPKLNAHNTVLETDDSVPVSDTERNNFIDAFMEYSAAVVAEPDQEELLYEN